LEKGTVSKKKDTKKAQVQWQKLVEKYQLAEGSLVFKGQNHRRIISKSQFYPLIYTFYNDLTMRYLKYKKILQKLMKRYY